MKSILRLTALLSFILCTHIAPSQKVYDKLAKDICKCMDKEKDKHDDLFPYCMEKHCIASLNEIKEVQGVATIEDVNAEELGMEVAKRMMEICPAALEALADESGLNEKYEVDEDIACDDLATGEFYYLVPVDLDAKNMDTTFVTITDTHYYERMRGGRTYSHLDLEWTGECVFKISFVESNDPWKNALSKPGDEYIYTIIQNNQESIIISAVFVDTEFHIELMKLK